MILALSTARVEIANFVAAVIDVYTLMIIAWIVVSLVLSMGVRIPYSRWSSAVISFLSEVSEPYLRIFRRLGLQIGPLDLSPMVAIIVLQIVGGIVVNLIQG